MGALGIWALTIGLVDQVAPTRAAVTSDRPHEVLRARLALLLMLLVPGIAGPGIGLPLSQVGVLVVVTAVSGALWLVLWRRGSQVASLGVLSATFVALLLVAGRWEVGDGALGRLLERSPFVPLVTTEYVVLVVGLAVLLTATGNRIVRVLLAQVEQALPGQEQQLKGGRVIGPLERVLIFGLGISGQLVAAGLVVTAKSLLRFSDLRSRDPGRDSEAPARAELMSEYLLVGSLLSWSLAFGAIGLAALAGG